MATQYHIFLGPIAANFSEVIVNIGRNTSDNNSFVVNVIKMYKSWGQRIRNNSNIIKNIRKQTIGEVIQTFSDIYWVHRAVEQGLQQHGIDDNSINNIISLCELIIKHITSDSTFNHNNLINEGGVQKASDLISQKYVNTLNYLVDLSVAWCLDKKIPILINNSISYKNPTAEQVYESVSYYCG